MSLYLLTRWVHIGLGMAGLVLGLVALVAPKFGRWGPTHRLVGRVYAVAMLVMAGLSVPLSVRTGNAVLFVIGVLTFAAVAAGWFAVRRVTADRRHPHAGGWLRAHVILMASSYISAWTAFLVNNPIFATGGPWDVPLHRYGPTVVGSALITWYLATRRRLFRSPARPDASPS